MQLAAAGPDGDTELFWREWGKPPLRFPIEVPVVVTGERDTLLKSAIVESDRLMTRAIKFGDPNRQRYPKDTLAHCTARSVWDMQYHDGRVYIGCGDWQRNQGPVDIWSFGPSSAGKPHEFRKEYTVNEESVDIIRSLGGKLYVPGTDPKDPWRFGNLYVKDGDSWSKLRTIPNGIHTFDVALFGGRLYVTCGTENGAALYESADEGKTWTHRSAGKAQELREGRFWGMAAFDDFLLVFPSQAQGGLYRLAGETLTQLLIPVTPNLDRCGPRSFPRAIVHRVERFRNGAVYAPRAWDPVLPRPLFFLNDFVNGAVMVEAFQSERVMDLLKRGDTLYVLTGRPTAPDVDPTARARVDFTEFEGGILSSRDMTQWVRLATFTTTALPQSLELMEGAFYVGLANGAARTGHPDAGSILRIER